MTWRGPRLVMDLRFHALSSAIMREACLRQFVGLFLDLAAALSVFFLFCSVWRWSRFREIVKRPDSHSNLTSDSWSQYDLAAITQAAKVLLNPMELICVLMQPLCLWRYPQLWLSLANTQKTESEQRVYLLRCIFVMHCDILSCAGAVLVTLSLYRAGLLRDHLLRLRQEGQPCGSVTHTPYHQVIATQVLELIKDFPFIFLGLLVTLSWRGPLLWRRMIKLETAAARRSLVSLLLVRLLLDAICFVMGCVVMLTVWRANRLYEDVFSSSVAKQDTNREEKYVLKWHCCAAKHFIMLFHPLEMLCVLLLPTCLWRLPMLRSFLARMNWSDHDRRVIAFAHVALITSDLACSGFILVVLTTGYRFLPLCRAIQAARAENTREFSFYFSLPQAR